MIPHYADKYDAEALYDPAVSVSTGGLPDLPPAVVLGFDRRLRTPVRDRSEEIDPDPARELAFYRLADRVAFVPVEEVGVGAPVAAIAAEKAIAAGARAVVVLGGCGAVQPTTSPEAVLLPTEAVRDEGVSYHYLPPDEEVRATPTLLGALEGSFADAGLETSRGPTWTTSALYRETLPEIEHYREAGFVSAGMESAAVWAVAAYRGADAATVHHVDGYLSGDRNAGGERDLPALLAPTARGLQAHLERA